MTSGKVRYLVGLSIVVGCFAAAIVSNELLYLLVGSVVSAVIGIGSKLSDHREESRYVRPWEIIIAVYYSGLALVLLLNLELARELGPLPIFGLVIVPVIPVVLRAEYKNFRRR